MQKQQSVSKTASTSFIPHVMTSMRLMVATVLLLFTVAAYSQNEIDSLQKLLSHATPSQKLDLTILLSKAYWSVAPAKGLLYANQAIQLAEHAGNQSKKARALLYGGVNYWAMGDYDNSLKYYDSTLRIAEKAGDRKMTSFALNNIGMILQEEGEYAKAMNNFEQALVIMKAQNDKVECAKIINSIGKLYTDLHKYPEALVNYQKVFDLIKNTSEQKLLLWVLNDIGEVYGQIHQPSKALDYFSQALHIARTINNPVGLARIYNNMGRVYLAQRNYVASGNSFHQALAFAQAAKAHDQVMAIWLNLSGLHEQKGDYQQALQYYKRYKKMNDTIYSESKMKNIINLQTRYETESKEKKIELLRKNAELNHLRISRQNALRNLLLVLLLAVVVISIIIYSRLQLRKRANHELAAKNKEIELKTAELAEMMLHLQQTNAKLEEQKAEIQQQVEIIREANNTKDRFFSIIAHDLKSPFNSILGFGTLLVEQIQEKNYEGIEEYALHMQNSSQRAFDLLKNLLDWSRSQTGRMEFTPEEIQITSLINEVIELSCDIAREKSITILAPPHLTQPVLADRAMLSTILRNLIVNAIKFTKQGGRIVIQSEARIDQLEVTITDTGVGITKENLDKLFRIEESFSTIGTQKEKGTGLGLILCKEFVEKHGGQIWAESEVGKGSVFHFTLPLKA